MPADAPLFSDLVAGWASRHDSAAARVVRELMGERDWVHPADIVLPQLALLLFVSDVGGEAQREAIRTAGAVPLGQAVAMAAGQPLRPRIRVGAAVGCPLTGWVNDILSTLFNALQADDGWLPEIVQVVWNLAVDPAPSSVTVATVAQSDPTVDAGSSAERQIWFCP